MLTSILFFFQAEDGIRDYKVTGVQTCALPICDSLQNVRAGTPATSGIWKILEETTAKCIQESPFVSRGISFCVQTTLLFQEIGRASCRKECRSRWSPYH